MKVHQLSRAERAKFEAAMGPVRTGFRQAYSQDAAKLLEKIDAAVGRRPR